MRLETQAQIADRKSRLVGIRLAMLTLRLRENWARFFGDPDTAAIALAIVAIVSEKLIRSGVDSSLETLAREMPKSELAKCNISSIAAATGFNRETARRKVDQLVRIGLVVRDRDSIHLAEGLTQRSAAAEVVRMQLDEVRRATDDLMRMGVIIPRGSRARAISG